ncbi:MAG: hypothetical protein EZS28_046578 [Streblomastix strix]|uniref:Uncharacterized protein n=1 Tax=Streblomastix strix TaxID=222440 RepID=A0A5J4THQ0_9EUKA|nr:MAG: hypothetical protein EZS28_046578 [Streblomastix strix]
MIAPWCPGQIWFTHLLTYSSRFIIFDESFLTQNPTKEIIKCNDMLPLGKIATNLMGQESNRERNYQQSFQTM